MSNNQVKHNSPFFSPVSRSTGLDFSDDLVIESELVDSYIPGPSGDSTDFVVEKKAIEVGRYHLNKVIAERAKGCSLKEVLAMCERTGDATILNSRAVSYGDGTKIPQTLGDACEAAKNAREFIESHSKEQLEELSKVSKMTKDEFKSYVDSIVSEKLKSIEGGKEDGNK